MDDRPAAFDPNSLAYTAVQAHPDAVKDTLLLVLNLHHQHKGEQPNSLHCVAERWLDTEEQPYERRLVIGTGPTLLDLGWFVDKRNEIGAIAIENNETRGVLQKLSEQEKGDMDGRIVEVYHQHGGMKILIRPGWVQLLEIDGYDNIVLRCQHQQAKCKLTVYPR